MKKVIVLYLFFFVNALYSQNNFKANSYLVDGKIIPLYFNESETKIKKSLDNSNTDYYYETRIIEKKNNRFFVELNYIKDNKKYLGWVELKHVGVGLRNNVNFNVIPIYEYSSYKSKKLNVDIHIESVIAKVTEIDKQWLKIYFYKNKKKVTGWLSPKNQCYNLYNMCTAE